MKSLFEYLKVSQWPSEEYIVEMATIAKSTSLWKSKYKIACHGTDAFDRPNPHIHIYLADDKRPYNKFNFEISICDILCKDEINLIKMRDEKNGIKKNNRRICSWDGYQKLKNDFEDWLFNKKVEIPGNFIDNLDACIYWYNQECDGSDNPIRDYIEEHGWKVLSKYKKYIDGNKK